ncbi:PREDICTED: fibrinogen-like protein 1 [Branchiostoma belcheri]|uniref:Fibrinogen-like protein 1 n=1 Tax=Branchiostoma belcheri TaxID=7741 RepID=A0A6P5AWL3_BRABE|nr:PREDICTED: fibrinogen-like protein 1 [Branchiostoma belcheri]
MSSKKLFPNGEAAPEGSVGRHGNQRTLGIVLALSGLAAVVGFVALFNDIATMREQQSAIMREIWNIQDQHTAFQTDQREQQMALEEELHHLKDQVLQMQLKQEKEAEDKGPAGSTDDWRRDDSATFWKSAEVHRRSKRNSESKTVVILGKRSAAPTAPPAVSDCAAFKAAGHTTSGVYTLGSPLSGVEVYCDMDTAEGGWTVIQRRLDGSVPFNRTWEEYKHGFGNKNGEYWLGNDNIHLLTTQKDYRLRIDMMDWDMRTRYAEYNTFRVSGESDQYRLTVSGYSGDAGASMTDNNGQRFSTVDRDNDACPCHCSQWWGQGGWWFWGCSFSFLNGRYLRNCGNSCEVWQGVLWYTWRGSNYSLKSVSMKIRPNN